MPVASMAGPETSKRIRGPSEAGSPSTMSSTLTSNVEIVVPWTTEYPVHCMPGRTSVRAMIGSPALAVEAGMRQAATVAAARRRSRMEAPA
jgi:hypothetical protein